MLEVPEIQSDRALTAGITNSAFQCEQETLFFPLLVL